MKWTYIYILRYKRILLESVTFYKFENSDNLIVFIVHLTRILPTKTPFVELTSILKSVQNFQSHRAICLKRKSKTIIVVLYVSVGSIDGNCFQPIIYTATEISDMLIALIRLLHYIRCCCRIYWSIMGIKQTVYYNNKKQMPVTRHSPLK